jgi:hypothetical protein
LLTEPTVLVYGGNLFQVPFGALIGRDAMTRSIPIPLVAYYLTILHQVGLVFHSVAACVLGLADGRDRTRKREALRGLEYFVVNRMAGKFGWSVRHRFPRFHTPKLEAVDASPNSGIERDGDKTRRFSVIRVLHTRVLRPLAIVCLLAYIPTYP